MTTGSYSQHLAATRSKEGVEISEDGRKILFYQASPRSQDGRYERAGYIHPLYSLNENILTEDFPEDHPYHHGIFWSWHQIIWNDKKIADGWISENISWQPTHLEIKKEKEKIIIQSGLEWDVHTEQNKIQPIIKENTSVTIFKSTDQHRILDFDINLFALVDNLKIGGSDDVKGYGGFCLRLKLPADISFVSGDSVILPTETAVQAGPWMDFTGSFDGKSFPKSGIAVFCKALPSKKQQWILRKEKSMQNVMYPGREPVVLPKNGLRLQYRLIIHNDKLSTRDIEKLYEGWVR